MVVDQITGPKPTKKSVTFMPARLAVMKCPNSWAITMKMIAKITSGSAQPTHKVSSVTTATVPTRSSSRDRRVSVFDSMTIG